MKRLLGHEARAAVPIALLATVAACAGAQGVAASESRAVAEPAVVTPAPAHEELGMAADAEVLDDEGGRVQLSSAWRNSTAVLVFQRGHW